MQILNKSVWVLGLILPLASSAATEKPAPLPVQSARMANPYESAATPEPRGQIDRLIIAKLEKLGVKPPSICSDAAFIRRVYLDVIGVLPGAKETSDFLNDRDTDKRDRLIDQLLKRDEFVEYWTMKWCDLLRVKAEFPINLWPNAVQSYHRWIHTAVRDNMPYDKFVRELLTSNGSNFRVGPVNFYRAMQNKDPQGIAQTVALTFMGERTDKWPAEKLAGMAGFFSQLSYKSTQEWKEEIVFFDPGKTNKEGKIITKGTFPGGKEVQFDPDVDPRRTFADWLVSPENPSFARNIANRAWSWLLGRGIIHEPDDIRPDNLPVNPELLAFLEKELIAAKWDIKHLFRLILKSNTYQFSSVPKGYSPEAEANFARYPVRRLEAEILIDALNQITGTREKYSSAIPEPFTFMPEDQRSIDLPDGSITSSFLEQFGRPARDTGMESERNNRITAGQRLHMLNSSHIQRKLETGPGIKSLLKKNSSPRDIIDGLYLTIISRFPTDEEASVVQKYIQTSGLKGTDAAIDLAWSLINSPEFLYRH